MALVAIVVSGAAVRLTGSGMGCPTWPTCEDGSLVPRGATGANGWIEFLNRAVHRRSCRSPWPSPCSGARRRVPYRPELTRWAWGLVAGVFAQALLGGLVVVLHVTPLAVAGHYLLSAVLVANAVVLHHKAGEPEGHRPAGRHAGAAARRRALVGPGGAGAASPARSSPAAGRTAATRPPTACPFAVVTVARVHSATVWVFLAGRASWCCAGRRAATPTRAPSAAGRVLVGAIVAQGTLGYVQYAAGVPEAHGGRARARLGARVGRRAALPPRRSPQPVPTPAPDAPRRRGRGRRTVMAGPGPPAPVEVDEPVDDTATEPDVPWIVLVWNDPINLMSYVSFVFQKLFGYPKEKADRLMMQVHEEGRAVVANGPRETCELHVFRLHEHGLWATMQHDR